MKINHHFRLALTPVLVAAIVSILASSARSGQVESSWLKGNWNCNIDGRAAKMQWRVVEDSDCGPGCQSSAVRWAGRFSDNGAAWADLRNLTKASRGGYFFYHADGNKWYLPTPTVNRSSGWTAWQGKRYPLVCWR